MGRTLFRPTHKVKRSDKDTLKLKGKIAPHGNEDTLRDTPTKDCAMCPPAGVRILKSLASLFGWTVCKADDKFLANRGS